MELYWSGAELKGMALYVETTKTKGENSVSREPSLKSFNKLHDSPESRRHFDRIVEAEAVAWQHGLSRVFGTNFANVFWTMMIKSMI